MRPNFLTALGGRVPDQRYAELVPQDELSGQVISDALADPRLRAAIEEMQMRPEKLPVWSGGLIDKSNALGLFSPAGLPWSPADRKRVNQFSEEIAAPAKGGIGIFLQSEIEPEEAQRILDRWNVKEKVRDKRHARAVVFAHEVGHALAELGEGNQNLVRTRSGRQQWDEEAVADLLGIDMSKNELERENVNPEQFYRYLNMIIRRK